MSRIREKLSRIFESQLPEFIRAGELNTQIIRQVTTTASSKKVTVNDTTDIIAGDKLQHPAITNTVYVVKILSSTQLEVSTAVLVSLSNQTVKFLRADSTSTFVKFIEAYYKFLEQDKYPQEILQNSKQYGDSETTIDELIESFFKSYGNDIPRNIVTDKRSFIRHFRDIYKTKGTEEAYKLLFRIMFNSSAEFFYPDTVILKTSDGQWKSDYTIKVIPTSFSDNPFNFINTKITGKKSGATAVVNNVLKFVDNNIEVYELYLENIQGNFIQENITATKKLTANTSLSVSAEIDLQLIKIDVIDGAAGYRADTLINAYGGSVLRIKDVDTTGKIKNVRIVNSSLYGATSSSVVSANGVIAPIFTPAPTLSLTGNVILLSNIGQYVSNVAHGLTKGNYANISFAAYPGVPQQQITVSSVLDSKRFIFNYYLSNIASNVRTELVSTLSYTQPAVLFANVDVLKRSEGYWVNSQGKLSELNYIQGPAVNSEDRTKILYQPYSYVVKSDISITDWKPATNDLIHPAGMAVFGEIDINRDISANAEANIQAEVWDYYGLTADSNLAIFNASSSRYTNSRVANLSLTTDQVFVIFGYL
jgi:hypothetical protein